MKTFKLEQNQFENKPLDIPYRKWKKWIKGKLKYKEFKELKLSTTLFCHLEMPTKFSLCWN